jgi:hypothetical protein
VAADGLVTTVTTVTTVNMVNSSFGCLRTAANLMHTRSPALSTPGRGGVCGDRPPDGQAGDARAAEARPFAAHLQPPPPRAASALPLFGCMQDAQPMQAPGSPVHVCTSCQAAPLLFSLAPFPVCRRPCARPQVVAFQAVMELMGEKFPGAFAGYDLRVIESHQSSKRDTSGTAKASPRPAYVHMCMCVRGCRTAMGGRLWTGFKSDSSCRMTARWQIVLMGDAAVIIRLRLAPRGSFGPHHWQAPDARQAPHGGPTATPLPSPLHTHTH